MDIRSLAAHLGLSIGTVSRALNGRKDVSASTRLRVAEAAAALGYIPNQAGRALRQRRTGTIAFILPVVPDSITYGDPFFLSVLEGVQAELEAEGLELIVLLSQVDQDPLGVLQRHLQRGIADGWILAATRREDARIALLLAQNTPFVTLGRSETKGSYPSIDLDFEGMVDAAMARLITAGHRRIAIITSGPGVNFSHIVIARYKAALRRAGLPFEPDLLYAGSTDVEDCAAATRAFLALPHPPTAIFAISETGPVGVYASLRAAELQPGRDIAVIGQRRTPACCALTPALTCFSVTLRDLGQELARALILQLGKEPTVEAEPPRLWPMTLIEGESVNPAPA